MTAVFQVASTDPADFVELWHLDVAWELKHNLEKYIVPRGESRPSYLVIPKLPSFIRHGLDTVRYKVKGHARVPGRNGPAASCCVDHGLKIFASTKYVQDLLRVNAEIEETNFEEGLVKELILDWRDNLDMKMVIPGRSEKATLHVPAEIKGFCHNLAEDLGVYEYELAILAMTITLSTQTSIHPDNREEMVALYENLLRRMKWRAHGTKGLLEYLTKGPPR